MSVIDWTTLTDEELVAEAKAGDNRAFAELVQRHQTNCYRQALSILRDPHDAEDEVQNALWKAFEHLEKFEGNSLFSTWLTRIVVNQCLMRLRKQKRAKLFYVDETIEAEGIARFEIPDERSNPDEELGRSEVEVLVRSEISRITPLFSSVI